MHFEILGNRQQQIALIAIAQPLCNGADGFRALLQNMRRFELVLKNPSHRFLQCRWSHSLLQTPGLAPGSAMMMKLSEPIGGLNL